MALPSAVLAYTTGAMQPWQALWNRSQDSDDVELVSQGEEYDLSAERPAGWGVAQEMATQTASDSSSIGPVDGDWASETSPAGQNLFRRPILLTPALLKCALLVIALPQAYFANPNNAFNSGSFKVRYLEAQVTDEIVYNESSLTKLLQRGGWHYLVSVAFRSRLQPKVWSRMLCETAHDWLVCAGEAISEPHPSESHRTLFFDLCGQFKGEDVKTILPYKNLETSDTQGEALWALIGGQEATQFEVFTKLVELHQAGLFDDIELRLRRNAKPNETSDRDDRDNDIGVLRFEELSDGEQMVLSRMALFHLLKGQQDALLLLDEPETHFNDKWKREIVGIIDDAISQTANDVLISTHSAIVLSDVFNDEIIMVQNNADGSTIRSVTEQTFATDPSALMMTVFEADDSIGKRAQEYIEEKLSQTTGTKDDIRQLEQLISRMGSGFYRSELRTLLNTWRSSGNA